MSADDLVHLVLGITELRDATPDGARDLGQLVRPENQEREDEDDEQLVAADAQETFHALTVIWIA